MFKHYLNITLKEVRNGLGKFNTTFLSEGENVVLFISYKYEFSL